MKRYIRAAVPIANLRTQFAPDMEDQQFQQLIELDPSADFEKNKGGKYCPWIFRQFNKGNIPESQYTNLKDALGFFLNNYKKYPKSDLGQYKTVDEFLNDTEAVGNRELTDKEKAKMLKKQAHHASDNDKKFCVEDGEWEVWQPLTKAGSISLSRQGGTKARWCTAYEGDDYYWNRYTREGPLYIFLNKNDPDKKYQLHFESSSWYDIDDRSKGMDAFYKFASEHPAINDFFEIKHENGVMSRATSIVGYDEDATEIIIPEGATVLPSFSLPESLEKIYIPDSVLKLKNEYFRNLPNLKEVRLPEKLEIIPSSLFYSCTALESITIPDSVKKYGASAFRHCTALSSIKHSRNLAIVEDLCFYECTLLNTQLPNSVIFIGSRVFSESGTTDIRIPDKITAIGAKKFNLDTTVKSIDLNNVATVGSRAFSDSFIESIDISKLILIGSSAFRGCPKLKDISLNPEGVNVGPFAFADNDIETTVKIYDTTELSLSVFDNCPNITIEWDSADDAYEFDNIKLLKCSEKKCPKLIKTNKGYVKIETTEGNTYEVE